MTNEELTVQARAGDRAAQLQLWEQVKRFTCQQANRWHMAFRVQGGVEPDDFIQTGFLALLDALESYNPDGGAAFITWYGNRLKTHFAALCGVRTNRTKNDPIHTATRFETPVGDDSEDGTLSDIIPDPDGESGLNGVEAQLWEDGLHAMLEEELAALPLEQGETLRRRYFRGLTTEQAAKEAGTTPGRVRQEEHNALRALRKPLVCKRIRDYVENNTNYYRHVGVSTFQRTGESAVERAFFERERLRERAKTGKKLT